MSYHPEVTVDASKSAVLLGAAERVLISESPATATPAAITASTASSYTFTAVNIVKDAANSYTDDTYFMTSDQNLTAYTNVAITDQPTVVCSTTGATTYTYTMSSLSGYTQPPWMSLDSSTGNISGTPPESSLGTTYGFTLAATTSHWLTSVTKKVYLSVAAQPVTPGSTTSQKVEDMNYEDTAEALADTTTVLIGVSIGGAIALTVMNPTSYLLMWATLNQNQLLILFLLSSAHVIDEVKHLLISQSFVLFNFNFMELPESTTFDEPLEWFGNEQSVEILDDLDFGSASAFNNSITLIFTFIKIILIHTILYFLPGSINPEDDEPARSKKLWVKIKKLWVKTRTKYLTTFKYVTYVRLLLEAHESLLI